MVVYSKGGDRRRINKILSLFSKHQLGWHFDFVGSIHLKNKIKTKRYLLHYQNNNEQLENSPFLKRFKKEIYEGQDRAAITYRSFLLRGDHRLRKKMWQRN